jgi:O-antigen/teichoic acid export membrane protein
VNDSGGEKVPEKVAPESGLRARVKRTAGRKFVKDTLILQAGSLVQSGTYFVTSVLTARALGTHELGRWATSRELYTFIFFLVSMGLTNAAVSTYSRARGSGDEQASRMALASMLKLGIIVSIFAAVFGLTLAPPLAERVYGDRQVGVLASVLCLGCLGEVLRSLTLAVLNGSRQMKRYVVFDATTNLLRVALVGCALLWEASPRSVAVAFLVHALASGVLGILAYRRAESTHADLAPPPLGVVLRHVPRAPLRLVLGVSALLAAGKALSAIVPRLGLLLIPALAVAGEDGFSDNGAFQVGMVLNLVLAGVVGAVSTNLLPTLGFQLGKTDVPLSAMGGQLKRVALAAGGAAALATLASVPVMWVVLRVFYGEAFGDSFKYFVLLASGNLVIGFTVIVEPFAIYAGTLRSHMVRSVILAFLAAAGIAWATSAAGATGAAAAGGACRAVALLHLVFVWRWFRLHGAAHKA